MAGIAATRSLRRMLENCILTHTLIKSRFNFRSIKMVNCCSVSPVSESYRQSSKHGNYGNNYHGYTTVTMVIITMVIPR